MKRILKGAAWSLGILAVSALLFLWWTAGNPEAFLVDDNRTQWFPVMEQAYAEFFRTGSMPVYDFYQMKGMTIADPGYYGIVNPLMLVSYALSHFAGVPFSTITIHIGLLFCLGTLCFYWLARSLGRSWWEALLCTAAYASMSAVFSFGYWYYVFNNYLFMPLLLLVFWRTRGRRSAYFGCGLVLALEILFGNVQYTCYRYMLFAILCFVFVFFRKRRYIGIFFSNIAVAVGLSAPFLLQLMRSSGGFGGNGEFHSLNLNLPELLLGALVPAGLLQKTGLTEAYQHLIMAREDDTWLWCGGVAGFLLVAAIGGIVWLVRQRKRLDGVDFKQNRPLKEWWAIIRAGAKNCHTRLCGRDDHIYLLLAVLLGVWLFTSFISDGIVAWIFGVLPVIKQFRYLFKCIFLLQPLMAVLMVCLWPYVRGRVRRIAVVVCCAFAAVGLCNNYFVVQDVVQPSFTDVHTQTLGQEREHGEAIREAQMPDADTYRYLTLIQTNAMISPDTFHYENGYLRNFATTMGLYSLSGYEIAAPRAHLAQLDLLCREDALFTRMIGCGIVGDFKSSATLEPERLGEQLISNAVKYIFVQKKLDDHWFFHEETVIPDWEESFDFRKISTIRNYSEKFDYTADVLGVLETLPGITVSAVRDVNEYYDVIVLDGVNGLCTDDAGSALPLHSEGMDALRFVADGADAYTLSFAYEPGLTAWTEDVLGMRTPLPVDADENGNTVIHTDGIRNAEVHLSYHDILSTVSFGFAAGIVLLFAAMLPVLLRKERNQA